MCSLARTRQVSGTLQRSELLLSSETGCLQLWHETGYRVASEENGTDQPPPLPGDLNPLPIGPATGPVSGPIPSSSNQEDSWESRWGVLIVALIPFILALVLRASAFGWSPAPVDPSNLAYCLFAVSLAGITRIISSGERRRMVYMLLICGLIQVGLGLLLAGTFDKPGPSGEQVRAEQKYLTSRISQSPVIIDQKNFKVIETMLDAVSADTGSPSATAYAFLVGTGLISAVIVLRYWAPVVREQAASS